MVQINEVMTNNVRYVDVDAPLREAMRTMHDADIRHVPVLDQGELVGILSDRDLREYEAALWEEEDVGARLEAHLRRPVSDVMNTDLQTLGPEADLVDAMDLMIEHKVGAIPVVEPSTQELVGIVSYIDALKEARSKV